MPSDNRNGSLVAQAQASVPVLESALEVAMNAIDVMLAKPLGTHRAELKEVQPIPGSPKIPEIRAPTELPLRRPDLIAAEQRVI